MVGLKRYFEVPVSVPMAFKKGVVHLCALSNKTHYCMYFVPSMVVTACLKVRNGANINHRHIGLFKTG
jgi:hypothetical protein